jgi:hypothetical protein
MTKATRWGRPGKMALAVCSASFFFRFDDHVAGLAGSYKNETDHGPLELTLQHLTLENRMD